MDTHEMGDRKTTEPKLVKRKWGYYQFHPLPPDAILQKYYAEKYFQEGRGSYEVSYTDEELDWIQLRNWLFCRKALSVFPKRPETLLDIGCGEGWLMNEFQKHGILVNGMDFSREGIRKFNPHLLSRFVQGNFYEIINQMVNEKKKIVFDIIGLCNVIEHVKYPIRLLRNLKKIMHADSLLIITAPNDFSPLHRYLIRKGIVTERWWIGYPDHLSYFNKESMCNTLTKLGYEVKSVIADNPIDLNLLNENSNYIHDKSKGKNTHLFRVRMDNFLASIDRDKLLELYEVLGSMGIGRNLVTYCSLK